MGFRDNGNFNLNWEFEGTNPISTEGKENSPFLFPDDGIRFLQAQAALDKIAGRESNLSKGDYKLHRGYIRNLEQPAFGGTFPISRCNFQFNPQQITQSVAMRDDIYLPMLQPPEQLAQPIGANTNFSFDLFFDRSHELAKGTPPSNVGYTGTADAYERNQPGFTASRDDIGVNDAYDIGVLADLRVFYSVIGQGFSKAMIEFQKKMFEYNAQKSYDSQYGQPTAGTADTTGGTSSGESSDTSTPPGAEAPDFSKLNDLMDVNIGNFALLMPNPVRVMFSSLFMVDGFITSTNVDFLKFSTKMVPVQCRIGVTMNALYIGFARQTTFLTKTFEDAANAQTAINNAREAENAELAKSTEILKTFGIGATKTTKAFASNTKLFNWNNVVRGQSFVLTGFTQPPLSIAQAVLKPDVFTFSGSLGLNQDSAKAIFAAGFPSIVGVVGAGEDKDPILKLFQEGKSITVGYDWTVKIYGGRSQVTALPQSVAQAAVRDDDYTDGSYAFRSGTTADRTELKNYPIYLIGQFSGSATASSKEEWGSGEKLGIRQKLFAVDNSASDALTPATGLMTSNDISNTNSWLWTSYYIVEYTASANIGSSTSDVLSPPPMKLVRVKSGSAKLTESLHFGSFPGGTSETDNLPSATADPNRI